jgi:hypothetical protein
VSPHGTAADAFDGVAAAKPAVAVSINNNDAVALENVLTVFMLPLGLY